VGHPQRRQEKARATSMARYGVSPPLQNALVAKRIAQRQRSRYTRRHWKTDECLVCHSSWEAKVIDYLNVQRIDFWWQPMAFKMPDGHYYIPDLYLVDRDLWVEIKGIWRRSKHKWDWFHEQYPNSEVWMRAELRAKGIL
jgi:hypothetical protein